MIKSPILLLKEPLLSTGSTDLNLSRGGRKKGMEILFKRCSADHTANIKCKKASVVFPVFWACLLAALLKGKKESSEKMGL